MYTCVCTYVHTVHIRLYVRVNEHVYVICGIGWVDGWMDRWMDGWMDAIVYSSVILPVY